MSTITINVLSSVSTGATSGYFILPGDFTSIFYPGYQFTFTGIGLLNLLYTVASSALVSGNTQVTVNQPVKGTIVTTAAFVVGTGVYIAGTYNNVTLLGGTGSGATATVVVSGPGPIYTLNSIITGGAGYTPGTYAGVALTGGTGTGAQATIVVYPSGVVGSVGITNPGTGYTVGDVLGASTIPVGSGFAVVVQSVLGTLSSVAVLNPGIAYTVNDVLSFGGFGFGLNNSITVTAVTTTEVGSIKLLSTNPMFKYGQNVYVINEIPSKSSTSCFGGNPFVGTSQMQTPAVQSGQILQITITTTDSIQTPTITYQVRLTGQTGVTQLDQSNVFVDKPTAIAAYSALML